MIKIGDAGQAPVKVRPPTPRRGLYWPAYRAIIIRWIRSLSWRTAASGSAETKAWPQLASLQVSFSSISNKPRPPVQRSASSSVW